MRRSRSFRALLASLLTRWLVKHRLSLTIDINVWRARLQQRAESIRSLPTSTRVTHVHELGVSGEWVVPPGAIPGRVIYYLHGGGFIGCSPSTHREMVARMAAESQASAFVLKYRLAPEHPYPAATDDALAGWGWLLNSGVDPASTIIGGDSAGGNLTLSLLLALRDAGGPLPAGAVVLSPWTDLTNSVPSRISNDAADDMLKAEFCVPVSEMYRAGADPQDPLVSPLFGDYAGMPPLLVHVSDTEILLDDSLQVVDKARAAGVLVELEVWSRLPHVWHITAPFVPEAREAIAQIGAFVKRTLTATPSAV